MKITDIECHIIVVPDLKEDATSSSQDDVVVLVHTDEGITGIGETDTGPWLVKAAIEAPGSHSMAKGIKNLLIGEDPFDTSALWEKLYTFTAMSGRREQSFVPLAQSIWRSGILRAKHWAYRAINFWVVRCVTT